MKVLTAGHQYLLSNIKSNDGGKDVNTLKFYNEKGASKDEITGTSNQEVLRALIDRVKYLDNELPHSFNKEIIYHLRKALALHEARHLTRMVDKDVAVENFPVGDDGHFICLDKENNLTEYSGLTLTDIEKVKETKGYREKKLFLKPTEDSTVIQDSNMPSATEVIYNAAKQNLSRKQKNKY